MEKPRVSESFCLSLSLSRARAYIHTHTHTHTRAHRNTHFSDGWISLLTSNYSLRVPTHSNPRLRPPSECLHGKLENDRRATRQRESCGGCALLFPLIALVRHPGYFSRRIFTRGVETFFVYPLLSSSFTSCDQPATIFSTNSNGIIRMEKEIIRV